MPSTTGMSGQHRRGLNWLFGLVGVSILGDTALYTILPLYAVQLDIPLWWVGILLSANRFVRLLANPFAAWLFQRTNIGTLFRVALLMAAATTTAYGLTTHLGVLLLARVLWGMCWSVMRLAGFESILRYAPGSERGRWLGRFRSAYRVGSLLAALTGGLLADAAGYRTPFLVFGAVGVIGLVTSTLLLRDMFKDTGSDDPRRHRAGPETSKRLAPAAPASPSEPLPPSIGGVLGLGVVVAWVAEGLVPSTLGYLIWLRFSDGVNLLGLTLGAATFTGFLLSFRWAGDVFIAPLAGGMADRLGPDRSAGAVFIFSGLLLAVLLLSFVPWVFATVAIILLGLLAAAITLSEVIAAHAAYGPERVRYIARYATATDLGSALGPVGGYVLGIGIGIAAIYGLAAALLGAAGAALPLILRTRSAAISDFECTHPKDR